MPFQKVQGLGKERFDLGTILSLKELRRSGEQDLHHPDAVLPGSAASGADLALSLSSVFARWLDEVEVVFAAGLVNVGVAGVFFFSALVVGLDICDLGAFVLGEAHDGVVRLCQGQPSL